MIKISKGLYRISEDFEKRFFTRAGSHVLYLVINSLSEKKGVILF